MWNIFTIKEPQNILNFYNLALNWLWMLLFSTYTLLYELRVLKCIINTYNYNLFSLTKYFLFNN